MLNNLLNTLSFGSIIQQDGKPYTVIMRLTDRLFVVMEQNATLPAPLMLAQVDLKMVPGQQPTGGQAAVPPANAPSPSTSPSTTASMGVRAKAQKQAHSTK